MNFEPDPLLHSLQTTVRGRLRAAAKDSQLWRSEATDATTEKVWAVLRKLGAPSFDAPVEADGMGLGLGASCLVAQELGRAGLGGRYLAVALAIDAAAAGDSVPEGLLDKLISGELAVALAGFEGDLLSATSDGALTGHLPVDAESGMVLVPARLDDGQVALILTELSFVEPVFDPSGIRGSATMAATAGTVLSLLDDVLGRARIRQAAYLLGLAHGALVCGAAYATQRRQFGQPLRDFQSVAFRLATAYASVEALRLAVHRAAWLVDSGQTFGRHAAEVLAQAAETAAETAHVSMQVCGVRAMTAQLPIHRYYLRIRREATRLGRPGTLWREAGRARLEHRDNEQHATPAALQDC